MEQEKKLEVKLQLVVLLEIQQLKLNLTNKLQILQIMLFLLGLMTPVQDSLENLLMLQEVFM